MAELPYVPIEGAGGPQYPAPTPAELANAADRAVRIRRDRRQVGSLVTSRNSSLITRQGNRRRTPRVSETRGRLAEFVDQANQRLLTSTDIVVRTAQLNGPPATPQGETMRAILAGAPVPLQENAVVGLDSRVTLLSTQDTARVQALAALVERLQAAGYDASMNQVAPCGYVTKADPGGLGPEETERKVVPRPVDPNRQPIKVAVIDTGISNQRRPDAWLQPIPTSTDNIDPLYEITPPLPIPANQRREPFGVLDFCAGHGTFVSGVVRQVAPDADVVVRRALGADGIGFDVDVAIAIVRAYREDQADVINLSLGTETPGDRPPLASQVALELIAEAQQAGGKDVVLVAAAGNNANQTPVFPAAFDGNALGVTVVSVAALDAKGAAADFSSRGGWVRCSTIGECVLSTFVKGIEFNPADPDPDRWPQNKDNPWATWTGTSFAAPQISGAIAYWCQHHPGVTPSQAITDLLAGAPSIPNYGQIVEILPGSVSRP